MSKLKKDKRSNVSHYQLSIFDGWRERVMDRMKATSREKDKGIIMIQKITDGFGISKRDIENYTRLELKRIREERKSPIMKDSFDDKINWNRDERGNPISPFSKRFK